MARLATYSRDQLIALRENTGIAYDERMQIERAGISAATARKAVDDVFGEIDADAMLEAARIYDEPRYRASAEKGGAFILLAQMPEPPREQQPVRPAGQPRPPSQRATFGALPPLVPTPRPLDRIAHRGAMQFPQKRPIRGRREAPGGTRKVDIEPAAAQRRPARREPFLQPGVPDRHEAIRCEPFPTASWSR